MSVRIQPPHRVFTINNQTTQADYAYTEGFYVLGAAKASLIATIGDVTGSPTFTFDSKVQGSYDNVTFADISSFAITQRTTAGTSTKLLQDITGFPYLRIGYKVVFTGGTNPTADITVTGLGVYNYV